MKEIIDLSYPIHEGMTSFASHWHPMVEINVVGRYGHEGRATRKVTFGTHTGTHSDAATHFIEGGETIDEVPLSTLMGEVTVINATHLGENEAIDAAFLKGLSPLKPRLLVNFGWGVNTWGTSKFYTGYPFFTEDAAHYCVENGIKLIAMDTPSPDDSRIPMKDVLGTDEDSPIHKILLSAGVILVEYVANLDAVTPAEDWNISVMPFKLKGCDGGPSRVCVFKTS